MSVYVAPGISDHHGIPTGIAYFCNVTVVAHAPTPPPHHRPAYPWPGHGAAVLTNPLRGLVALPKRHYSWGIDSAYFTNLSFADGVLMDFVRITHSAPLTYGRDNPIGGPPGPCGGNTSCVMGAVLACARATAVNKAANGIEAKLGINWSPWTHKFQGRADPTSTKGEQADLHAYTTYLTSLRASIAAANLKENTSVRVGAVMLDSERFTWTTGASTAYIDAITRKNELVYNATRAVFPSSSEVTIVFYDRGAVHSYPEMNTTQCVPREQDGRPVVPRGALPPAYCISTGFSYRERFESSSPFTTSLYALPEQQTMRDMFRLTSDFAATKGVQSTWPYIALGTRYRRCLSSIPSVDGKGDRVQCPVSQYLSRGTFDFGWTYDPGYSALMGAQVNQVAMADSNWGPWHRATAVILYPAPFDTRGVDSILSPGRSSNIMDHFVAYVRGAAGTA